MTLADEDTNSILTDNANMEIQGNISARFDFVQNLKLYWHQQQVFAYTWHIYDKYSMKLFFHNNFALFDRSELEFSDIDQNCLILIKIEQKLGL